MRELMGFAAAVVGISIDPFAVAGYVSAGMIRKYGVALCIACAWAIVVNAVVASMVQPYERIDVWAAYVVAPRLASAVLVCSVVWLIRERRRKKR
jgi:hypothetical protein